MDGNNNGFYWNSHDCTIESSDDKKREYLKNRERSWKHSIQDSIYLGMRNDINETIDAVEQVYLSSMIYFFWFWIKYKRRKTRRKTDNLQLLFREYHYKF